MSERKPPTPRPVRPSHFLTAPLPPAGLSGASGIPGQVLRSDQRHGSGRGAAPALHRRQIRRLGNRGRQTFWSTVPCWSSVRPAASGTATTPGGAGRAARVWGQGGDDVLITGGRSVRPVPPAPTWGRRGGLLPTPGGTTADTLRCPNAALSTCPQRLLLFPGEVFLSSLQHQYLGTSPPSHKRPGPPAPPGAATPRPRLDRCGVTHPADPAPGRHKLVEVDSLEVHD
jgi:hypothetical protein